MDNFSDLTLVPIIVAIVEALKSAGFPAKYSVFVSLILGLGGGYLISGSFDQVAVVQGVILGLSASGLYSGARSMIKTKAAVDE